MRCRRYIEENGKRNIVNFGSYGLDFSGIKLSCELKLQPKRQIDAINQIGKDDIEFSVLGRRVNDSWQVDDITLLLEITIGHVTGTSEFIVSTEILTNMIVFTFTDSHSVLEPMVVIVDIAFDGKDTLNKDFVLGDINRDFSGSGNLVIMGKAKRVIDERNEPNYAFKQEAVVMSLTQRLSIIKGELKHYMNVGFPLFDRKPSKAVFDSYTIRTILNHPDVIDLIEFKSAIENRVYVCNFTINTSYGNISFYNSQNI